MIDNIKAGGDVIEVPLLPPREVFQQMTAIITKKAVGDWLKESILN
ncbi:MAG: hypothetical protein ACFFBD_12920 [Candidatus Hodarchaeota archaeon]